MLYLRRVAVQAIGREGAMARFGLRRKSTRKSRIKGFNPEYLNNRSELRRRKKIGLVRTVFSGVSLLCGASMIYVSMHYIPAFVQPKKVVKFVTGDSAALKTYDFDRKSTLSKLLGPYVDLFHMDRTSVSYTHLRAHETSLPSRMPSSA